MRCKDFQVRGSGEFPLDMLRYDACWPATEMDSATASDHERDRRRVNLRTASPNSPTPERWESFGWKVSA